MKLHTKITAPTVKSKLRLRDLKPGALFRFVEPQGEIKFGLVIEGWHPVEGQIVYFYNTYPTPVAFPMSNAVHANDLVELIEGPDASVTLTSNP